MIAFKAQWVARRLPRSKYDQLGHEKFAEWTKDHRKMMRVIGKALKQDLVVDCTFRKPLPDERFARAVEIGQVVITGTPRHKRTTK